MGVKNLWNIIGPYGHKASVVELQKKKVAVDLSCWICENQILGERSKSSSPKLHLRNIFFRASVLLLADITPVFVMDGDPPVIKGSVLSKRIQQRVYNKNLDEPKEVNQKNEGKRRKMHKFALKECEGLLRFLGLECVWSSGEGEALCALFDQKGIVDGIITQDGDAFLYGARKVYKNFTVSSGFGTVDVFKMSDIEKNLNLTQEKLIAMSLLCGCDYNETGIHGIGATKSLKYLSSFSGDIIKRLKQLKYDKNLTNYDAERNGCKKCHHPGKLNNHIKSGCKMCGTHFKCVENSTCYYETIGVDEKARVEFELEVRHKTVSDPTFPDLAIVNEYLNFSQKVPEGKFSWMEPDILGFVLFMEEKCNWTQCYAFQKIIPLYCRWSLLNSTYKDFSPSRILKKRVVKGVPSFEVEWKIRKFFNVCKDHDNCIDEVTTTVEPQILVAEKCGDIFERFMAETNKKSKKDKRKKDTGKQGINVDDLIVSVNQLSIEEKISKSNKSECEMKLISKNCYAKNAHVSPVISDSEESSEHLENSSDFHLDDSVTVDYDLSDYKINESSILDNIIARRQFY